jgi:hypothetical protein
MKMKTSELSGATLDWAVALIEFPEPDYENDDRLVYVHGDDEFHFTPSTDWAQGGPIIESEWISVSKPVNSLTWVATMHYQNEDTDDVMWMEETGTTPLIAAMRCYVGSKLGDEVEVPEELLSCKYCGGNCMLDNDHACDGYLGDIDKLYAND